jgi:hypothetical protein
MLGFPEPPLWLQPRPQRRVKFHPEDYFYHEKPLDYSPLVDLLWFLVPELPALVAVGKAAGSRLPISIGRRPAFGN